MPAESHIVVRPSGIWNSRIPLYQYQKDIARISRTHAVTAICAAVTSEHIANTADPNRSFSTFFRRDRIFKSRSIDDHARHYVKSYGLVNLSDAPKQKLADFQRDCYLAHEGAVLLATVRINSLIEVFICSWSLNYLLAKLESGLKLLDEDRSVLHGLNPAKTNVTWSLGRLLNEFGSLRRKLENIPPYFKEPGTRVPTDRVTDGITALRMLRFFQNYRNNIIHKNGIASPTFFRSWGLFYNK